MKTLVTKIVLATRLRSARWSPAGLPMPSPLGIKQVPKSMTRRRIPDTDSVRVSPRSPVT